MALKHNHSLQAARTMILQNQAQEITANLRPNPTLSGDTQFLPIFTPSDFNAAIFRQQRPVRSGSRLPVRAREEAPAPPAGGQGSDGGDTAQVGDNERTLTFNVASQFIAALLAQANVELADTDLKSFQQTVDIGEEQTKAGAMSEGDLLKIKLQMLQFQTDVSAAKLARIQAHGQLAAIAWIRIRSGKL